MRAELEQAATRLLISSGTFGRYPVNLGQIEKHLHVKRITFLDQLQSFGEAITFHGSRSSYMIINTIAHKNRRRFSIAHELAHIYLRHPGGVHEYARNPRHYDWQESEANYMAGAILMPRRKFLEVHFETDNIRTTAEYFGVSREAAGIRLEQLGYSQ